MKKFVIGLIIGSIVTGTVGAVAQEYILKPITYDITVNGKSLQDKEYPMLNLNGTTYLSHRKTTEAIGAELYWNQETRTAELTTVKNNDVHEEGTNTNDVHEEETITSGSLAMKSDFIELGDEPVKYVINDSEYYIEFSRFASCTTSDAQNYYIKIPGKGELTLPKQEGSDKIKPNSSIIEYGNSTYIKIAALNFTTEIKDNKLWLK